MIDDKSPSPDSNQSRPSTPSTADSLCCAVVRKHYEEANRPDGYAEYGAEYEKSFLAFVNVGVLVYLTDLRLSRQGKHRARGLQSE
jgi:hypothetical protein